MLEQAHAADAKHNEIRNDLALTADARGLVYRDLGQIKPAEQDFRRALELLDKLWLPSSPPCPVIVSRWPRRTTAWA